jgi:hypothetical protein
MLFLVGGYVEASSELVGRSGAVTDVLGYDAEGVGSVGGCLSREERGVSFGLGWLSVGLSVDRGEDFDSQQSRLDSPLRRKQLRNSYRVRKTVVR